MRPGRAAAASVVEEEAPLGQVHQHQTRHRRPELPRALLSQQPPEAGHTKVIKHHGLHLLAVLKSHDRPVLLYFPLKEGNPELQALPCAYQQSMITRLSRGTAEPYPFYSPGKTLSHTHHARSHSPAQRSDLG